MTSPFRLPVKKHSADFVVWSLRNWAQQNRKQSQELKTAYEKAALITRQLHLKHAQERLAGQEQGRLDTLDALLNKLSEFSLPE